MHIGEIVHYQVAPGDIDRVQHEQGLNATGNTRAGDLVPAIVLKDWGSSLNLHVLMDGPGTLWKTSITEGDREGTWNSKGMG